LRLLPVIQRLIRQGHVVAGHHQFHNDSGVWALGLQAIEADLAGRSRGHEQGRFRDG
jgi:hypothetical protein